MVSFIFILYEQFHFLLNICFHTLKYFQKVLFNTNNSIKHKTFVYTRLKDQTVLF